MPLSSKSLCRGDASAAGQARSERVMWINDDRVFYRSLLGVPSSRCFGSLVVYASLGRSIHLSIDGGEWQSGEFAVVQPYVAHRVLCDERTINVLHLEPETIAVAALPAFLKEQGIVAAPEILHRVRQEGERLSVTGRHPDHFCLDFDEAFFDQRLPPRQVDPRVARVLQRMRRDPAALAVAEDCAAEVGLSFSRFLHLFKEQSGASFRAFRAWKRARSLLHHVNRSLNLTHVALDAGYPDATHFSHSIRRTYGLTPKDIFAGSRRLMIIGPGAAR